MCNSIQRCFKRRSTATAQFNQLINYRTVQIRTISTAFFITAKYFLLPEMFDERPLGDGGPS